MKLTSLGWWLAKHTGGQAWVPAAYVEEQAPAPVVAPRPPPPPPNGAAARGKPTPPQPPVKRPAAGRKPAPTPARDSGLSLNGSNGSDSRSNTPTPSLGNSLADALLARKNAMAKKDEDDDW